jgi:predicted DNA-binding transcriptional regulator AlpA
VTESTNGRSATWTLNQAAAFSGLSMHNLRKLAAQAAESGDPKLFRVIKSGPKYMIPRDSFLAWFWGISIDQVQSAYAAALVAVESQSKSKPTPDPLTILPDLTELISIKEAARLLAIRPLTLYIWRKRGQGPPSIEMGSRNIRYSRKDIEEFIQSHRKEGRSYRHD